MKKYILLLLLFLCFAFTSSDAGITILRTRGEAAGECTNYLICQNFEGTGYDNSETWTESNAAIDEDETTTVLRGSQSLYMGDGTYYTTSPDFTDTSEVWVFLRYLVEDATPNSQKNIFILMYNNGGSNERSVVLNTDGTIQSSSGISSTVLSEDTTYYIWFRYKKGTGGNGEVELWISTSTTKPGSSEISVTTTDDTNDIDAIQLWGSGVQMYFDQVYVDDAAIGNVDS